ITDAFEIQEEMGRLLPTHRRERRQRRDLTGGVRHLSVHWQEPALPVLQPWLWGIRTRLCEHEPYIAVVDDGPERIGQLPVAAGQARRQRPERLLQPFHVERLLRDPQLSLDRRRLRRDRPVPINVVLPRPPAQA